MKDRWLVVLFCASVVYLALFYKLGNLAFIGADEPRYARVGEEMLLQGNYVTPTLNFRPWLEKPPLLFWIEAASFHLFGVREWSARLPVTLLAMITLAAVGLFVSRSVAFRPALLAVLILCTSPLFFIYARAASTDMPLTAMLTMAMCCGFYASQIHSVAWAALAGIALGLAVLAKGPVAVILFGGVFLLYALLRQQQPWSKSAFFAGLVLFLITAAPWFWLVWHENGYDFVVTFLINHHLARFLTDLHHHSQPFWYYPVILLLGFFPWIFFLASALRRLWQWGSRILRASFSLDLFLWLWIAVSLGFFSLSESKLPGYILPVIPPLSILVALEWDRWLSTDLTVHRVMKAQLTALAAVGLILLAGLVWVFHDHYQSGLLGVLVILPVLGSLAWGSLQYAKRRYNALFLSLVAGMTLFGGIAYWKAAPVIDNYHSARDICLPLTHRISSQEPLILYRYFHHTARYYTNYQTTRESVDHLKALQNYFQEHPQKEYYLLTQQSGWKELQPLNPRLLIKQGNLYLAKITSREPSPDPAKKNGHAKMSKAYELQTVQYVEPERGGAEAFRRQTNPNVHVWTDGLRLRAHRQFSHFRFPGYSSPLHQV